MAVGTYENHLEEKTAKWFAIYTRYKREKIVHQSLNSKGIEAFLPINKVLRQWERKKRIVALPLINCYVFVKITKADYVKVLAQEYVVKFVHFSKNLISIPQAEIDTLKRIVDLEIPLEVNTLSYQAGDIVEVISGNLAGLQGRLIAKNGKHNFTIALEHIGYNLALQVDPKLLKRIDCFSIYQR